MGVDYTAYTVVGVRIPNPFVQQKIQIKCGHENQTNKDDKFCSECGNRRYQVEEVLHPKLLLLQEDFSNKQDFHLVSSQNDEDFFVGRCVIAADSGDSLRMKIPNFDEEKAALKSFLEDLYEEKEFGIWTILQCC